MENVILGNSRIAIKFQGGFVGSECKLTLEGGDGKNKIHTVFYPDDINDTQIFPLINGQNESTTNESTIPESCDITKVRLVFERSSDFFGRIIIYNLEMQCSRSAWPIWIEFLKIGLNVLYESFLINLTSLRDIPCINKDYFVIIIIKLTDD